MQEWDSTKRRRKLTKAVRKLRCSKKATSRMRSSSQGQKRPGPLQSLLGGTHHQQGLSCGHKVGP